MKKNALKFLPLAVAVAITTGCKPENTPQPAASDTNSLSLTQQLDNLKSTASNVWEKTKDATTNTLGNMKTGATNAWNGLKDSLQSAADYTFDKKDGYVASAQASLDSMDQKIKDLSDKAAAAADAAKADAQAKLQAVNEKRTELGAKFDKMKAATADSWDNAKTDFKNTYDDVNNMVNQAWQSLTN
jgi:hypothetical protein